MADKPFTPGASCSTKQQSNIIYEKRGMAVWPHENKYEYQLFAVSPQGVFLLVKTPDRGPGSICGPLFNERENWRDFLSADSRLRRLILQVCGRDVRRDLIQARNDYVLDVALNKFQTEKEESKPFRFALSSSCEENVQQSVVSFQYENISEASDLSSRDNESGMSSKNEKKPNEYYLHDRNIMHRDLKTQNIFLSKFDMVKVGDLGIARVLESSSDMATTLIGTPYYMSPELFTNRPYNYKSDIWALGCVVYEMATLKHAFDARDMNGLVYKIIRGKIPPMPRNYSSDLCDMIKSMLSQSPARRPSITRLLKTEFIKSHIRLFLKERKHRKASSKSRTAASDSDVSSPSRKSLSQSSQHVRLDQEETCVASAKPKALDASDERVTSSTDSTSSSEQTLSTIKRPLPPTPAHVSEVKEKSPAVTPSAQSPETQLKSQSREQKSTRASPIRQKKGIHKPVVKRDSSESSLPKGTALSQSGAQYNKAARAKRRERSQAKLQLPTLHSKCLDKPDGKPGVGERACMEASPDENEGLDQTFVVHDGIDLSGPGVNADMQMLCTVMDSYSMEPSEDVCRDGSRHSVFLSDNESDEDEVVCNAELSLTGSPSGRLFYRVQRLKSDCLRSLGEDILQQCMAVLVENDADSDSSEESLMKLLGPEKFRQYGVKLSELHFCQDSLNCSMS